MLAYASIELTRRHIPHNKEKSGSCRGVLFFAFSDSSVNPMSSPGTASKQLGYKSHTEDLPTVVFQMSADIIDVPTSSSSTIQPMCTEEDWGTELIGCLNQGSPMQKLLSYSINLILLCQGVRRD